MNSRHHRVRNIARSLCAAAIFFAAAGVSAQTVYKHVNATGRTTFTDQPDTTPSPRPAMVPAAAVAIALASNSAIASPRAAAIDRNEAERRLGQAQLARAQGTEPQPGEQARGADASVVNSRYWRRQEKLQRVLEQAKRRAGETRQPQLAGR